MKWTAALLVLLACAVMPARLTAQDTGRITGVVTDAQSNAPVPAVSVSLDGTTRGVVTGPDGRYTLTGVSAGTHSVRATRVGYATAERTVTVPAGGTATLDLQIGSSVLQLDEIVAVGYGTARRQDLTGSVASVNVEAVRDIPVVSVDQLLQGTAPGVQVSTASSAPGGGISIRVRGGTSISEGVSNEPLYVIDGFPIEVDYAADAAGSGGRASGITVAPNPLTSLNPRDIESIQVLKDASATAIYGSRAANGVVLITTRQGVAGAPRFNFEAFTGIQNVAHRYDLLNGPEYAQFANEWAASQEIEPLFADPTNVASTDWQDRIFRQAPMQSYQLSVTGGTSGNNATRYAVSAGYFNQDGVVLGSAFDRMSLRLNLDQQVGSRLRIGSNLTGSRVATQFAPTDGAVGGSDQSAVAAALQYLPTLPVRRPDGSYSNMLDDAPQEITGAITLQDIQNPVAVLANMKDNLGDDRILGNSFAEYTLTEGLTLRSTFGANISQRSRDTYWPRETLRGEQTNGQAVRARTESNSFLNENTLNFNRMFGQDHLVNAVVGFSRQVQHTTRTSILNENFINDILGYNDINAGNRSGGPLVTSGEERTALQSYLGRLNYNLLGRYIFTATGRYDGSSRFGPQRRWGFFPSGAFAWRASEESFLRDNEQVNDLKFRVAYGATGNAGVRPYQSLATLDPRNGSFGGTIVTGYRPGSLANEELGWETTRQFDAGMDLGLWDNLATLTVDYYNRSTTDLLLQVQLPLETGFREAFQNAGEVRNRGWEVALGLNPVRGDGQTTARWSNNLIYSRNRNKVIDLGPVDVLRVRGISANFNFPGTDIRVGYPIGVFYGYQTQGLFRDSAEAANYPAKLPTRSFKAGESRVLDLNGDSLINELDRTVIGDPNPEYNVGWNSNVAWRGFELSTLVSGSIGADVLNLNLIRLDGGTPTTNVTRDRFYGRWTPENPDAKYPAIGVTSGSIGSNYVDTMLEDGSFVRLANVTLSYNVPSRWIRQRGLRETRLYVSGNNLHTWTKYSGYNPDVSSMGVGNVNRGVDVGAYPLSRTITLGVNVGY
ncbi:SusC/RagA family TonB-linked outer membrane protein [Longimicrobium terrae]|uniref:TonB-linked SusC/RagA family outer membrane protein n=1 Tax=Longimicrobium terrae TaxID=1639882 RepID=A0A841GKI8_9BACT|nr:TonB-dependent receptor [Longimicrobium terrae]MBB4634003.1 TonB-linked SusC/RagA family outer membrane protein [Longimicrobium terrae]MBB6069107.1 TonB-linked SusC/RagA family outer membrane protein [Longimicrobium terrae]NNC28281.1 TonB-dependent receptor [Longimicrobium terrae]